MSDLGLRHAQKTCLDLPHIHIQNYLTQFFLEQAVPGGGHLRSNQQASEKTIAWPACGTKNLFLNCKLLWQKLFTIRNWDGGKTNFVILQQQWYSAVSWIAMVWPPQSVKHCVFQICFHYGPKQDLVRALAFEAPTNLEASGLQISAFRSRHVSKQLAFVHQGIEYKIAWHHFCSSFKFLGITVDKYNKPHTRRCDKIHVSFFKEIQPNPP